MFMQSNPTNSLLGIPSSENWNESEAELMQLQLIHLFASELLLMNNLDIEKTKTHFYHISFKS